MADNNKLQGITASHGNWFGWSGTTQVKACHEQENAGTTVSLSTVKQPVVSKKYCLTQTLKQGGSSIILLSRFVIVTITSNHELAKIRPSPKSSSEFS